MRCRRQYVDQDFKSRPRQSADRLPEELGFNDKEPAHRIGYGTVANKSADSRADRAELGALRGKPAEASSRHVAAGHDDIEIFESDLLQHFGEDALVMLQIGIHDGNVRCAGRHHAFDACGRKSATPNALDSAHLTIPGGKVSQQIRRTVGGMIVDEYCFPNNAFQGFPQRIQEERSILLFIVSGNYDRQLERKVLSGYRRIECRSLSVLLF